MYNRQHGFTIVELLVVIVVIGILAAIGVLAFNGVQRNATVGLTQADLRNAGSVLATYRVENNDRYPTDDSLLTPSNGTTFTYTSDGTTYCLQAQNGTFTDVIYRITSATGAVEEGECGNSFETIAWQTRANDFPGTFSEIAASTDGLRLVASTTTTNNNVYTSSDGGATWIARDLTPSTPRNWRVTSSASGQYLAAATFGEAVKLSTDFGATWTTSTSGSTNFNDVDISDDGQVIQAARSSGGISLTTNGGGSWSIQPVQSTNTVVSTHASSNGQFVLANIVNRTLWRSTNSGVAWTQITIPNITFYDMTISQDGQRMIVIGTNSVDANTNLRRVFVSDNGGSSWTEITSLGVRFLANLTLSYDGTIAALRADTTTSGKIFTSNDAGLNWTEQTAIGTASWGTVSATSTGATLFVTQGATLRVGTYN